MRDVVQQVGVVEVVVEDPGPGYVELAAIVITERGAPGFVVVVGGKGQVRVYSGGVYGAFPGAGGIEFGAVPEIIAVVEIPEHGHIAGPLQIVGPRILEDVVVGLLFILFGKAVRPGGKAANEVGGGIVEFGFGGETIAVGVPVAVIAGIGFPVALLKALALAALNAVLDGIGPGDLGGAVLGIALFVKGMFV